MEKRSVLVEAVSGRWHRLPSTFREAAYVLDLPNGILLNVHADSGYIEIYSEADDNLYHFSGEMFLEPDLKQGAHEARILYRNEPKEIPSF